MRVAKPASPKTEESAIVRAVEELSSRVEEFTEAITEAKPPQVKIEAAQIKVDVPAQQPPSVEVKESPRPKSFTLVRTDSDGRKIHYEGTFHY